MGGNGRLLDNDEVEFLLKGGQELPSRSPEAAAAAAARDSAPREITMRGDLDKINLSDIFQTLAMSKMQGLLRVRGPLESREIHFEDGFVRCIVPRRVETLRLGQRLVRSGLVTAEQLRSALLEQRKTRSTIGDILVEQQLVTHDDVDEILSAQLQEDLFGLFTWPQGTFEFYKGDVNDPVIAQRLAEAPRFEVNGVLLEVARRSDEWMRVIDAVGSLDELILATDEQPLDGLDEDAVELLGAANGRQSVRDLAEHLLTGLFECGRLVRELLHSGHLRKLSIDETLAVVGEQIEGGEPRRAVTVLRALLERGDEHDVETIEELGNLFARCGENRQAADLVLRAARVIDDPDAAVRLARHARELDKLSADVLSFLTEALQRLDDPDPTELIDVLADLVDALADRGEYEDALAVVEELESTTCDLALCRPRKARILSKLGRQAEAVDALLGLVELYKEKGDRDRVAAIYEQVLKIDFRRKDVARALKSLHATKLARRGRVAAIAAVLASLGFAGYVQVDSMMRQRDLDQINGQVSSAIERGDLARANELVRQASVQFGDSQLIDEMQARLIAHEQQKQRLAAEETERIRSETLTEAIRHLREGRAEDAVRLVARLSDHGLGDGLIGETMKNAVSSIRPALDDLARSFPERLPRPPALEQSTTEQAQILENLRRDLASPTLASATALLAARDVAVMRDGLGRDLADLVVQLEAIEQTRQRALSLEERYAARLERRSLAKELTPLFHEAREHERNNRFEAALEAYRTLERNHPEDDELRAHFQERIERYSTILRYLEVIAEATERGDFATAQGQLRATKRQFPDLPFDGIARLPVRVQTTPAGARVFLDGQLVGEAPLVTSYRPAESTRVRIELDGFQPEETILTGDTVGVVRSLLARIAHWTARRDATIDRAPTLDGKAHVFVTDRAGVIACLRATDGALIWSHPTEDLSGMLTRPCLLDGGRLVVGSIDGSLRCLNARDGELLWTVEDLPTESTPLAHGAAVLVATDDARILGLDIKEGRVLWETRLPAAVRNDLVAVDQRTVIAITSSGHVVGLSPAKGELRYELRAGRSVACEPARQGGLLAVASEDGLVTLIEAATGRARWTAEGFSTLVLSPAMTRSGVLVADGRDLHLLDLKNGRRLRTLRGEADLTAHLSRIGDLIFVGDASGLVRAIDVDELEPRFVLRADGPALAPITALADGTLIGAFQDRTLRAYLPVAR